MNDVKKMWVTEDQALGKGVTLESLVKEAEDKGFISRMEFTHEAVGRVHAMYNKKWLKDIEAKLSRKHKGNFVRDITLDPMDNIHYLVIGKDDTWRRLSCSSDDV